MTIVYHIFFYRVIYDCFREDEKYLKASNFNIYLKVTFSLLNFYFILSLKRKKLSYISASTVYKV